MGVGVVAGLASLFCPSVVSGWEASLSSSELAYVAVSSSLNVMAGDCVSLEAAPSDVYAVASSVQFFLRAGAI